MDKDKNIYITPELYQSKIKTIENIKIEKFKVLFSNSFVQLKQVKNKEEIHIYDIGNNNTSKQSIIGDTEYDLNVSKAIGCDCLLFSAGHFSKNRLKKLNAAVVDSVDEMSLFIF